MTRYQFLRFLLFGVLSLMFYPLRALAARFSFGESPYSITPAAGMQTSVTVPTGLVTPITPNSRFYVEDIHGPPKQLKAETWYLKITGKVDRSLTLSLDQIRKRPTVRRIITLSC
ncbi:MAG: molybdopterin-dependent oxidoreductase, partial [Nitrospinaceae bacterium]